MAVGTVGVVGLGTMGAGIVEVFARGGLRVVAAEIDAAALERGRATLTASTQRAVTKGRLSAEDAAAIDERITYTTRYDELAGVDLAVEAAPERIAVKRAVFTELDRVCRPDAILATNTSSLSVTEIAHHTGRPDRVVGMHFFNPAPVMKLVEVIGTVTTDPAVTDVVVELCGRLGKVPVGAGDRPGFVANYLLLGYLNQAAWRYQESGLTADEMDDALRLGAGLPMGPLTLMDLIGIDTIVEILDVIHGAGGGSRRHAAAPVLRQLAAAGLLGRKTGRGFHRYAGSGSGRRADPPVAVTPPPGPAEVAVLRDPAAAGAFESAGVRVHRLDKTDPAVLSAAELVVCGDVPVEEYRELGAATGAVLAVDSAMESLVERAVASGRPADLVGLHLVGDLVEIGRTVLTGDAALDAARGAAGALGRTAVVVPERAGLLVDALVVPYLNDAVAMLAAGYADADGIDHAMTLGCGYPVGPIAAADRLGPARVLSTAEALHAETGEPSLAPHPLLRHLAAAGRPLRP